MSRDSQPAPAEPPWLTPQQQHAWLAYMRLGLRLRYEMNRQLQEDADLSLADYDVMVALADAPAGRLQLTDLAATIGWERSRLSHHLQRMCARGLTSREPSSRDGRATDAVLTPAGQAALDTAAPGHVALVRRLFFDGLDEALLPALTDALEQGYAHLLRTGTLPLPPTVP